MRKALLINLALFAFLFALHVVFASAGWDLAFSVVAMAISAQLVLFGPFTVILEGASSRVQRRRTNRVAGLVDLPLVLGLAWAYGGMAWAPSALLIVFGMMVSFHLLLDVRLAAPQ